MSKKVNLKKINQNNARKQQALQKLQPGSPKKTVVKKVPVRELTVPQLIKHADEGNIACMRELYEIYKKEYEATHSQAALDNYARYLQMAAEAGDALSQYNLSVAYQEGKRLKKDTEKCMYWMSRCADSSPVTGHFWLGKFYRQGSPVPAD
ncbi:MAG: sel1 repeat family protein, partial [Solobacterium sp.]|nr:sel1 repeat family protein [Solobacterium sp.]